MRGRGPHRRLPLQGPVRLRGGLGAAEPGTLAAPGGGAPDVPDSVLIPVTEISTAPTDRNAEKEIDLESGSTTIQVEFSCNDDAKDYLEQTFGFVRSKLHNREDIVAAGKTHGVDIIFV